MSLDIGWVLELGVIGTYSLIMSKDMKVKR